VILAPGATTGATEEYDGTNWANNPTGLNTARRIRRCRNSNCSFSFWWSHLQLIQEQQKNMTEQLGHQSNSMNTAREV
jgi:hypothetical protein